MKIQITCNGETHSVESNSCLTQVLQTLGYQTDTNKSFAVAVNNSFIPRSDYDKVEVSAEDQLEVIGPMQGG